MSTTIIVTSDHTEESIRRFRALPGAEVVFAEDIGDIKEEDLARCEIYVGNFISPEMVSRMPKLRMVQTFSAGANGFSFLPEEVVLANAYGAYGDSIADHPLWTAPRAYLTPHISGGYRAGVNYERVIDVVIENLTRVLDGRPPIHAVDRALGY